jgi:RsgA GTPase
VYLHALGWNSFFQSHWNAEPREGLVPARVTEEQRDAYRVVGDSGEMSAEITGHLRHIAADRSALPAVGDWVGINVIGAEGKAFIHSILPRRTKLSRKEAGRRAAEQILVTNVDTVFLMMSLNADLNPRRIERYLGTLWESGALPVIVLSKADLCPVRRLRASRFTSSAQLLALASRRWDRTLGRAVRLSCWDLRVWENPRSSIASSTRKYRRLSKSERETIVVAMPRHIVV